MMHPTAPTQVCLTSGPITHHPGNRPRARHEHMTDLGSNSPHQTWYWGRDKNKGWGWRDVWVCVSNVWGLNFHSCLLLWRRWHVDSRQCFSTRAGFVPSTLRRHLSMSGDISYCHKLGEGAGGVQLASNEHRSAMLLNILLCTAQSPLQKNNYPAPNVNSTNVKQCCSGWWNWALERCRQLSQVTLPVYDGAQIHTQTLSLWPGHFLLYHTAYFFIWSRKSHPKLLERRNVWNVGWKNISSSCTVRRNRRMRTILLSSRNLLPPQTAWQ